MEPPESGALESSGCSPETLRPLGAELYCRSGKILELPGNLHGNGRKINRHKRLGFRMSSVSTVWRTDLPKFPPMDRSSLGEATQTYPDMLCGILLVDPCFLRYPCVRQRGISGFGFSLADVRASAVGNSIS